MTESNTATPPAPTPAGLRRRPVAAVLAAIPLALGIAVILFVTKTIELSLVAAIVIVAVVLVLGGLWGAFGPARPPSGEPPSPPIVRTPPPSTRFDDVGGGETPS